MSFKANNPTFPSSYQPKLSGSNALAGAKGEVGAQTVTVKLEGAYFGGELPIVLTLNGKGYTVQATQNGDVRFELPAADLNALAAGVCKLVASTSGNVRNCSASVEVGTLTVSAPVPTNWSIRATFKATMGFKYPLVPIVPDGWPMPTLTFTWSNECKCASIDASGVLTAKNTGAVTLTATDASDRKMKCKIMVACNGFSRSKPLMLKLTAELYYMNNKLYAEVFDYSFRHGM